MTFPQEAQSSELGPWLFVNLCEMGRGRLRPTTSPPVLAPGDVAYGYYRTQRKFTEDIDWSYAGNVAPPKVVGSLPGCSNRLQTQRGWGATFVPFIQ